MELIVDPRSFAVGVAEQENLRALAVRLPAELDDAAADAALRRAGLGSVQDGHAWLDAAALARAAHAAAPTSLGPAWDDGYTAMLQYARDHGWWRESDGAVRAHLERPTGSEITSEGASAH